MEFIYKIDDILEAEIIKRPSQYCKTPYVADGVFKSGGESHLIHTPALGCCGLCDKNSSVIVSKLEKGKKCSYRSELAVYYDEKLGDYIFIGINPKLAETLIDECLNKNKLDFLKDLLEYKREKKIEGTNSRFDFAGVDKDGNKFVMEIKNVPLADYVDCTLKDKKKLNNLDEYSWDSKISYFPDGYRKKSNEPISPRALKHINDLINLKERGYRSIMCYVIQRGDSNRFQPSVIDETYRSLFYEAQRIGVEMYALQFVWDEMGNCYKKKLLDIV